MLTAPAAPQPPPEDAAATSPAAAAADAAPCAAAVHPKPQATYGRTVSVVQAPMTSIRLATISCNSSRPPETSCA